MEQTENIEKIYNELSDENKMTLFMVAQGMKLAKEVESKK